MHSSILEDISQDIYNKASQKISDTQFGSVILTVMIIGIIVNLIRVAQECQKKQTNNMNKVDRFRSNISMIRQYCHNRTWFTKMRIKKIIRQKIGGAEYKKYSNILLDTLLDTGENLTDDQFIQLLEICNV